MYSMIGLAARIVKRPEKLLWVDLIFSLHVALPFEGVPINIYYRSRASAEGVEPPEADPTDLVHSDDIPLVNLRDKRKLKSQTADDAETRG